MPNTTGKILEIRVCEKGDKANLTNSALVNFAKTVCDFLIFTTEHCLAKGGFKGCGKIQIPHMSSCHRGVSRHPGSEANRDGLAEHCNLRI